MLWDKLLSQLYDLKQRFRGRRSHAARSFSPLILAFGLLLALAVHLPYKVLPAQAAFDSPVFDSQINGNRISGSQIKSQSNRKAIAQKPAPDFPLRSHPLPALLAQWHDPSQAGDYFDQIKVVPVGYLIWSHFPITIYLQPPTASELANPFTAQRSQVWLTAVAQAVQAWQAYLPLKLVNQADGADIVMTRTPPPLQLEEDNASAGNQTGNQDTATDQRVREQRPPLRLGRARSAMTSYKIYAKSVSSNGALSSNDPASTPILAHRFTIQLRPDQAPQYLQAAALHELGHALGIWGHSLLQTDVMYFSQVRQPPPISSRDLNTLKRIYEQPTRLGWALSE